MALDSYRLLGRSGLRVSPLALGTMTFGWGADRDEAQAIFDAFVGRGGNFVDTANGYANGTAEQMVGDFAHSRREQLVIATKYSMPMRPGDPNSGGNSRKSMVRSVEASLSRLQTDYVDLLYLHLWDGHTPVEEVLRAMDDLVRAGKVLYLGISDIPAWEVARMQAIAELRGWSPLIALQIPYNLVERTVERDLIPMAGTMGLGVVPWSPLAGGVLAGKYGRSDLEPGGAGGANGQPSRKDHVVGNGFLTARGLDIAEVVKDIAAEVVPHRHDWRSPGRWSTPPSWRPWWALGPSLSSTTTSARSRSSSTPRSGHGWRRPAPSIWVSPTRPSAALALRARKPIGHRYRSPVDLPGIPGRLISLWSSRSAAYVGRSTGPATRLLMTTRGRPSCH
jgi:aryl-alcohol dehydrogenase-like predicted oxidoreductase